MVSTPSASRHRTLRRLTLQAQNAGQEIDMEIVKTLARLNEQWRTAKSREERERVWHEMLAIHADQVFVIGTISRAPIPLAADAALRNVPRDGLYAWDPGAHLGIHRIDEFFFEGGREP
jgi:peptide/nickel transport system substrate-binding protein